MGIEGVAEPESGRFLGGPRQPSRLPGRPGAAPQTVPFALQRVAGRRRFVTRPGIPFPRRN